MDSDVEMVDGSDVEIVHGKSASASDESEGEDEEEDEEDEENEQNLSLIHI